MISILLLWVSQGFAGELQVADQAYRAGRYQEAEKNLVELLNEDPRNAEYWQRLGAARFRAGNPHGAAQAFEHESRLRGGDADAEFNAGNAHYQAGRLEEAISAYERALKQEPTHGGAAKNRESVLKEIQLRRQQQQQQQQQQQNQNGDGQQQQQDGDGQQQQQQRNGDGQRQQRQQQDSESGHPQDSQDRPGQRRDGNGEPKSEDGRGQETNEDDPSGEASGTAELSEEGPEGQEQGTVGKQGQPGDPNQMSPAQAGKVLDGVEEGRPRIYVPGGSSKRPW